MFSIQTNDIFFFCTGNSVVHYDIVSALRIVWEKVDVQMIQKYQ